MVAPKLIGAKLLGNVSSKMAARSGILGPLIWLVVVLLAGVVALASMGAATWMLVTFTSLFGGTLAICLILYALLAFRNPSVLRSEQHALRAEAIETLIGDSVQGLRRQIEIDETDGLFTLTAAPMDSRKGATPKLLGPKPASVETPAPPLMSEAEAVAVDAAAEESDGK